MTEQSPNPQPTFNSPRDEVLYRMAKEAWATKSAGNTEALSGWFARIGISVDELTEIVAVFGDTFDEAGLESSHALLGHWIVRESQDHSVGVVECADEKTAKDIYEGLENVYRGIGRLGVEGRMEDET